jgi:hypothetical protein
MLNFFRQDIANHQLKVLRPSLTRISGQFELQSFKSGKGDQGCLQKTREWLAAAHSSLLARSEPIPHHLYPPGYLQYQNLQRNQQAYIATIKGLTDIVFTSPSPASPANLTPQAFSNAELSSVSSLLGYPETTYLDTARILRLSTNAVDLTALYMFLLLYRQLRFASPSTSSSMDEWELAKVKCEIHDIGSARFGCAFYCGGEPGAGVGTDELGKWRALKQSVVLQIAMRAWDRTGTGAVDKAFLGIAQRWADENIQHDAVLAGKLRVRLRDAVFHAAVGRAYPGRDTAGGALSDINFAADARTIRPLLPNPPADMEVLAEEIGALVENIARLALIHINAYLPLYQVEHFLDLPPTASPNQISTCYMAGVSSSMEQVEGGYVPVSPGRRCSDEIFVPRLLYGDVHPFESERNAE